MPNSVRAIERIVAGETNISPRSKPTQVLAKVAAAKGVDIRYSTPARQLVADKSGAVTGAIAQREDGEYVQVNAKNGVIIATGDYSNDDEMVDYYIPDLHNFERKQNNQTGDGHKMGMWVGAAMEHVGHTKMLHDFDAGPASMCDMPFWLWRTIPASASSTKPWRWAC